MKGKPEDWLTVEVAKKVPAKVWKKAIVESFASNCPMDPDFLRGWLEGTEYAPKEVRDSWQ